MLGLASKRRSGLLEAKERTAIEAGALKRGPYKKRNKKGD